MTFVFTLMAFGTLLSVIDCVVMSVCHVAKHGLESFLAPRYIYIPGGMTYWFLVARDAGEGKFGRKS